MNAQKKWKIAYHCFMNEITDNDKKSWRIEMDSVIREAALERKLEAANRRIADLSKKCAEYDQAWQAAERRLAENNRPIVISDHDARLLEQWRERM